MKFDPNILPNGKYELQANDVVKVIRCGRYQSAEVVNVIESDCLAVLLFDDGAIGRYPINQIDTAETKVTEVEPIRL